LFRYDSSDPVRLTGPQGALLAERIAPDTWRFPTQTDAWYVLTVGDNDEAVELQPSEEPSSVKSFIDCYGDVDRPVNAGWEVVRRPVRQHERVLPGAATGEKGHPAAGRQALGELSDVQLGRRLVTVVAILQGVR